MSIRLLVFKVAESLGTCLFYLNPFKSELLIERANRFARGIKSGYLKHQFYSFGDNNSIGKVHFRGKKNISIGSDCYIGTGTRIFTYIVNSDNNSSNDAQLIDHNDNIVQIGNNCSFGHSCFLTACNSIILEDGVLLGSYVTITDNAHGYSDSTDCHMPPREREIMSKGPVIIGKNVWIGDKATILPGVQIGEGSIIGANTVVTQSVPAFSVVVGTSGRIVKGII